MSDEDKRTTKVVIEDVKDVPFPGGGDLQPREKEVRIAFEKKPYADMIAHAVTEPEVELCGVLVGHVRKDKYGPWLHVVDIIRGEKANQKNAQVTFTHDTWNHIHSELDKHPDRKILGWYHTHGGFGIFLSEMDTFIHENFFTEPHHFAYVYDPLAGTEGFFFRHGKQFHQATRYWVGGKQRDVLNARPEPKPLALGAGGGGGDPATAQAVSMLSRQVGALQSELAERGDGGGVMTLLVVLALVVFGAFYLERSLAYQVQQLSRRERVMVKVQTDPVTGLEYGVELIPLPLRKAEVASGLFVYQDRTSGQFFAADGLAPISSSAVLLDAHVQAAFEAARAGLTRAAPPPAPAEAEQGGPNMIVILLALGAVVGVFVAAGVLVKRRTAR